MGICATCKHWDYPTVNTMAIDLGSCESPGMKYGYSVQYEDVPINGALVENDEGWGMLTRPAFGCVLHEVKE